MDRDGDKEKQMSWKSFGFFITITTQHQGIL